MENWKKDMIEHHGILGQKWGKKNGPPYPLSRTGKWSAKEKLKNATKEFKEFRDYVPEDERNADTKSLSSGPPYPEKSRKEIKEEAKKLGKEYYQSFKESVDNMRWEDGMMLGLFDTKNESGKRIRLNVESEIIDEFFDNPKRLLESSTHLSPSQHGDLIKSIPSKFPKLDSELRKQINEKGRKIRWDYSDQVDIYVKSDGTGSMEYMTGLTSRTGLNVDWKNGKILN